MMSVCPGCVVCDVSRCSKRIHRQISIAASFVLMGIFCLGSPANPQSGGRIAGPGGGAVAGAAVGAGAAVAIVAFVVVSHGHHSLTGCAFNGPNGMKLKTSDSKVYSIDGDSAAIKAGEKVKLHGARVKAKSADGDQTFKVEKLTKDFGPCHVDVAAGSGVAPPKP